MFTFSKEKNFLLIVLLLFIVFVLSYISLYNFTVKSKSWGVHSYKNFLLENTKDFPRIIVDAGSSTHHSINSNMLEEEFNKVTINLGDNGGYPLKNKLLRVAKQSKAQDIIILPLEYIHYSYNFIPTTFYDSIFGPIDFYYNNLNSIEKIVFMSKTPFSSLFNAFFVESVPRDYSYLFVDSFNNKKRGDFHFVQKSKLDVDPKKISCESYLFATQIQYDFELSDIFKENMKLLKQIEKEKSIKFIITYPAVTGKNCYNGLHKEKFDIFIKSIDTYFTKNNISFLGDLEDSNFSAEYRNNSYYHVTPQARDIRTQRLIEHIKKSDFYPLFLNKNKIAPQLNPEKFVDYKDLREIEFDKKISISSNIHAKDILLYTGWYKRENWGVWSNGKVSKFMVKIDKNSITNSLFIEIKARVYGEKDKTKIVINDKVLGEFHLHGRHTIEMPKSYLTENILKFELHHKKIVLPKNDGRKLKLGLEFIKFTQ